jgi:hypothetical protein
MLKILIRTSAVALLAMSIDANAETVIPANGQSQEQVNKDAAECQATAKTTYDQTLASANQAAAASTTNADSTSGGRARGAAVGAAAGAAAAQSRCNRNEICDHADSDVQQEYRQNQAKDAAVAGAVVGGAKQRQNRRQQGKAQEQQAQQQSASAAQSAEAASKQSYSACMGGKGYTLSP